MQCVTDLSSNDESIVRAIIHAVRESLSDEPTDLSDAALQRITNIIGQYRVFNSKLKNVDEILTNLHRFDRQNHEQFIEKLKHYLSFLFVRSLSTIPSESNNDNHNDIEQFDRTRDAGFCSILDLTPKQKPFVESAIKSNDASLLHRKNDEQRIDGRMVSTLADVVAVVGHVLPQPKVQSSASGSQSTPTHIISGNDNQDLAEADQICNSEDVISESINSLSHIESNAGNLTNGIYSSSENDFSNENIGAVGGIASSQLPDLAKVSTNSSRILSFEEDAINPTNVEPKQSYDAQQHNSNGNFRRTSTGNGDTTNINNNGNGSNTNPTINVDSTKTKNK